ncbi:MAG: hypothetical protein IJL66_08355 [Lachnospiraceae bacterium]|nr:hypothetical protein [Lachnospiraceae bacterium]
MTEKTKSAAGEPLEIERKFLIAYPDVQELMGIPSCYRTHIVQTYLLGGPGETARVRSRGIGPNVVYTHTVKRRVSVLTAVEEESEISRAEYLRLLETADPGARPIEKDRYAFRHAGHVFEIDVYPFWTDRAVMEVELSSEKEEIVLPPCITVLREVSADPAYKNAALARRIPE